MKVAKSETQSGAPSGLYKPLDFVSVRAPLLPVEFYNAMNGASLSDLSLSELVGEPKNDWILRAIHASSPALVRSMLTPHKTAKDGLRAKRKLRRYLIRMSTRPTPFGALAGVGVAALGERTTLRIHEDKVRHTRQLDVPWLLEFIHHLESDPAIFRQLKLFTNPCAIERGNRIHVRELNLLCSSGKSIQSASIKASAMVRRALDAARTPLPFHELMRLLAGSGTAAEEKIERFITELWRQEFLLTELRPPFTNGAVTPLLRRRLESLYGAEPYLLELERKLATGNPDVFRQPRSKLDAPDLLDTPEEKRLIHIDSVFPASGVLNVAVAREASRAAEVLLKLTPWPAGLPYLAAYRQAFEDRYGTDREVPILEMSDREYGIGVPPVYDGGKTPPAAEAPPALRLRRETLFEIARAANDERRLEVELDEEILRRLETASSSAANMPVSLEINVFVSAASSRDLDEGRFTIVVGPNVGSMEAGRSLGRFVESLGTTGTRAYRTAAEACEAVTPDRLCVELNYLPRNLQLTNIIARPAARKYEINVGVQPGVPPADVIPLHDLVIGVSGGRFYVKSLKLNRILHICSGHMANIDFAPAICRLLTDLTLDGTAMLRDFDWGIASMHPFLPRVRMGRVVLSVAKWRISDVAAKQHFGLNTSEAFQSSLARWREEWKVPRQVHLTETDNRLVLDLENEMDIEDLRNELRQLAPNGALTLEEVYPALDHAWLPGAEGRFVAEFVVPLVVKEANQSARNDVALRGAKLPAPALRLRAPGSDWLYLKLYAARSLEDDLLTGPVRELTCWAREAGIVDNWFFVRYADPLPHLRLRFHGDVTALSGSLLPRIVDWAQQLVKLDRCMHFAIDTYEREIERYGGVDAIGLAEELFASDSETVLSLLRVFPSQSSLRREDIAVFGLDFLLCKLGHDSVQKLGLIKEASGARHESGSAYRERKNVLHGLFRVERSPLSLAVEAYGSSISEIGTKFNALDSVNRLCRPLAAIYRSVLHMHCNRLGLDLAAEKLAYGLLARSYEALRARSMGQPLSTPRVLRAARGSSNG